MSDATIGSNAGPAAERSGIRTALRAWLHRRRAYRARLAYAEWDLHERYGDAAHAIARSSAQQAVGSESRRFWNGVAARLRRRAAAGI